MLEYLLLLVGLLEATLRRHGDLVTENLLLRQQLTVLTRPTRKRPRLLTRDRLFWVLARSLRCEWRRHLRLVRPETVIRWHRRGWRRFWRWRSRARLGRPRLSAEIRNLIATIARDNPRWGSERIRGELLKLGIRVSKRSVQRYRRRGPARPPSQTWRTFLANHAGAIWAVDLCTVQTLTFRTLYVLVLIAHGRRDAGARRRDGAPGRRLGLAPTRRGDGVGSTAPLPPPGPGRRVRRRLRQPARGAGG